MDGEEGRKEMTIHQWQSIAQPIPEDKYMKQFILIYIIITDHLMDDVN